MARPYPVRSSAEPTLLFFDIKSKYAAIILKGTIVDAPTVIYIPYHLHYSPEFRVWATSKEMNWDKESQLLYWHPSRDESLNQLIIGKEPNIEDTVLPERCKNLLEKTRFMDTFS
jgi:Glycoside hydrolase family 5 C-terminal domain